MENQIQKLTKLQLAFVDAFMECGNKAQALIKAGYSGNGKKSTVTSQAAKMYNHPVVNAEIKRRREILAQKKMINSEQIIERLSKMFNGELKSEFMNKKGELVEVPISYKNQIEAAKVMVAILGLEADKKVDVRHELVVSDELSEELKKASEAFLAKRVEKKPVEIPAKFEEVV
ncbi:MAG: hypothetical protein CVV52_16780 [Spirochaetae bacterium HGW-Spirochaetae-8]|nr:MAG: hypothetical protein CVV52_16780 [Spirochaetae bacterium HGW-Spirochaetae-8]